MAGYSGKPLLAKLGFKPGWLIKTIGTPDHYMELLGNGVASLEFTTTKRSQLDAIHIFISDPVGLAGKLALLRNQIKPHGMIWVSWPKQSSSLVADVKESDVRSAGLDSDLVDIKVCAVDDDWSALKFVIPKEERGLNVVY